MENFEHLKSKTATSAYIHIPFCRRKCSYCAFTSFVGLNFIEEYIQKLSFEIKTFYKGAPLETLYIGGGTPSLLNLKQFKKILKLFKFAQDAEITVELNPESTDLNLLAGLRELGVNRLSFGVQNFDDDILKSIGRIHTGRRAKEAVYLAQDVGFENVSIDLIYGLPSQTLQNWHETLEEAKSLMVPHISLYGLKIEENTVFSKNPPKHLPDDDLQADMYELAIQKLAPEFKLYEISNFARSAEYQSRHNLNYWNDGEYFGFGVAASGFINNIRYKNSSNFKEYILNPEGAKELIGLTLEERLEETIFLGFRKKEGININEINEKFGIDFNVRFEKTLSKFISSGHLVSTENGYSLTTKGILVSNVILSEFLC